MFKLFNLKEKTEIGMNKFYVISRRNSLIEIKDNNVWEYVTDKNILVVPDSELTKEKVCFVLVEPADFDYIDVYRVNDLYIIHDYNTLHDKEGVWCIVNDIDEFIEKKKTSYSFICYKNYMKEL